MYLVSANQICLILSRDRAFKPSLNDLKDIVDENYIASILDH